jgi:putative ABC transport system permease protein
MTLLRGKGFRHLCETVLIILLAAVLVILLIACANIANLMLTRATRRAQEMAIRSALGAGKFRLMRQLFTESSLLAVSGGAMGILFAYWLKELLLRHAPFEIPRLATTSLDLPVLAFAAVAIALCALLFGLAPALQMRHLDIHQSLAQSAANLSGGGQKVRRTLVVANIGMALLLLSSAGLLLHSLRNLLRQELGFQPDGVVTMTVSVIGPKYDEVTQVHSFYNQALQMVAAIPGVWTAGIVSQLPLSANRDFYSVRAKDKPHSNPEDAPAAERYAVSADYLKTLGISIIQGRGFSPQDTAKSLPVVLVNRKLADRIWPGENPLGKQIQIGELNSPWRTVVGVVREVRHQGLEEPFGLQFYMPFEQWSDSTFSLIVKSNYDALSIVPAIRKAIAAVDKSQPVSEVASMTGVVESNLAQRKTALTLVEFFAAVALFLSAIGVYGVVAYDATRRMHEIGIRIALSADNRNIVVLLTASGLRIALVGIAMGTGVTLIIGRFLEGLLFQVKPADPVVLAGMAAILLSVAVAASTIPAFRVTRSNPLSLLRQS